MIRPRVYYVSYFVCVGYGFVFTYFVFMFRVYKKCSNGDSIKVE